MDNFFKSTKRVDDLHHAYLFVGDQAQIQTKLLDFLQNDLKIQTHGNPDFKLLKYENLTVDDAREIKDSSEKKNLTEGHMFFILSIETISAEAQNSLLKVFEEPSENTHFIIVSPQDNFLPTLKSRMQIVYSDAVISGEKVKSVLSLNIKERLDRVKAITEAISDEEATKQDAINFLNEIEDELYKQGVQKYKKELSVCAEARLSLLDRGAPVKMILENLVLSI